MARYWILGNGGVQGIYLVLLFRYCRNDPYIKDMAWFYGPLCLSLIYTLPALFYLTLSKRTKSADRVFIVWGCVTTFLVSVLCAFPPLV